ncbi:hypothetical protein SUGI_0328990 [Cryptomeria japonica]|nr:hypothetical protein SUGI_0328990 [Cryptomeria japonica]
MGLLFAVCVLLLLCSKTESLSIGGSSTIGINYGQLADNIPSPSKVAQLLQGIKIKKVKLYDSNPEILKAFAKKDIALWVGIGNENVAGLITTQGALAWLNQNLTPYLPDTKIVGISVGNEIYTGTDAQLSANLVPAMSAIHSALVSLGLDASIQVSTAHSIGVLGSSYPPSAGAFREELTSLITPHLELLSLTGSPFWLNAYPFFAYKDNPGKISLDYVLFKPNQGMDDPATNLHYDNMLYAQVDACYTALSALGYGNLEVRVSETGWPSKGDPEEIGASIQNAQAYNRNLLVRLAQNQGTPMKPTASLEAYVFALFNEDLKPGPTSERNYGLYKPDGVIAYYVGLGRSSASNALSAFTSSAQGACDQLTTLRRLFIILLSIVCSYLLIIR